MAATLTSGDFFGQFKRQNGVALFWTTFMYLGEKLYSWRLDFWGRRPLPRIPSQVRMWTRMASPAGLDPSPPAIADKASEVS